MRRRFLLLTICSVLASMGAEFRTRNFIVNVPNANAQTAQQVGQWAEHYRKEKALQWLGYEMPPWNRPCPLTVIVSMEPPQGKTSFSYMNDQVVSIDMEIQGPIDRLMYSVLPHEVTHTVFAHYFRCAVPRWADEGGSVLSEDSAERVKHDQMTRDVLNRGQGFRLRTLMNLTEYPANPQGVMWLYAQGYSLSDYLVKRSDHRTFLAFVAKGMQSRSWNQACMEYFGHRTVEELEEAWLKHLRDTRRGANPDIQVAANTRPAVANDNIAVKPKTYVKTTLPPAQPLDPVPLVRGAAPTPDQVGRRFGDTQAPANTPPIQIPGPGQATWQPAASNPYQAATVQVGQPQFGQPAYAQQPQQKYAPAQYTQPQCNGPQCQPYYQQQFNQAPAAPFGYPR